MALFGGFDISASALSANRVRMDVVAGNIANANTTRAEFVNGKWQPYRRKMVEVEPINGGFDSVLKASMNPGGAPPAEGGVRVTSIVGDKTPFKTEYDPSNPDADANGMVSYPNVDMLKEMVDLMEATRAYESNAAAINASKAMATKALEIGKA
ncbi:flagellar basal-body rod protein FlgC [Aneurinibacillus soli]|uniref:Flagellar basal-body rod protein FlgC n=1 Tax=Aneurinibacillus soli TaxID=1500254 RepID=A0A0U5B093_9BACL|nr:flagellar basal body rod protein FlgC [Aneurinibacillus soli]PYE63404.1 flagellar basal-body rod protein FlgC [Aneurinibacillus soli]BAU27664.1 Flagellar basal-body rod protein FlgC [Aneurinibacillus soli]